MRRTVLAFTALLPAAPALAEPARVSLVFGQDRLTAQAEDIRSVRRIDDGSRGAALVIRLVPAFDAAMRALTTAHVGETGQILICGETVMEPVLHSFILEATFVISDTDTARIDRLQALLAGPTCTPLPES